MKNFKIFAFLVLAVATVSTLSAETRCPANVASITFRLINDHQMIVPVSINYARPYNFLLDTRPHNTRVDPPLATDPPPAPEGQAGGGSAGPQPPAPSPRLDRLEAGTHAVA